MNDWDGDLDAIKAPVAFDEWPEFEKREYRRAEAWRDLWLALADLALLRRVPWWDDGCRMKAASQASDMVRVRARAEALVWQKRSLQS